MTLLLHSYRPRPRRRLPPTSSRAQATTQSLPQVKSFHSFPKLPKDLKLCILAFVAEVSAGDKWKRTCSLTHVLPFVSKQFRDLCQSDYLWKNALEILVRKEPFLWREGLLILCRNNGVLDASAILSKQLVTEAHGRLSEPGYQALYKMVRSQFQRFSTDVFSMPSEGAIRIPDPDVALGELPTIPTEPALFRLSVPRDGFLIQYLTEGQARGPPQPRYIVFMNVGPQSPACLMRLAGCTVHSPMLVTVWFDPVKYVKIESIQEDPPQFRLPTYTATCLCLRDDAELAMQLEQAGPTIMDDNATSCVIL